MKTRSKALLLTFCAVLLVAASVLGTMAYLTSQDIVTNTFTVGNVAITLDETNVGTDGTPVPSTSPVKSNSYKLLPGHTYTKDPTIHVATGSEDCYLFVKVDNQISTIEKSGNTTVAEQMKTKGWKAVEDQTNVYVYVGTDGSANQPKAVSANTNVRVFDQLVIDGSVTNEKIAEYKDKTIVVNAYAIQKDGFENETAAQIWQAAGFGTTAAAEDSAKET